MTDIPIIEWFDDQKPMRSISRRDWFAGMAMQGLLACEATEDLSYGYFTGESVRLADALIAELDKE